MNTTDQVLDYIKEFIEENQYPPTRRDIMDGLGISSTSVVQYHIAKLENQGKIEVDPGLSRGIRIPNDV
jgi:repressor LexA